MRCSLHVRLWSGGRGSWPSWTITTMNTNNKLDFYITLLQLLMKQIKPKSNTQNSWRHLSAIDSLQELTCLHSKLCLLRAELLRQRLRSFTPLWTSFHLLRAAFAVQSGAVLNGEDVLYEEGSQRFDCVRHFHHSNPQIRGLSVPEGCSSVSPHTLTPSEFIQEQGRVYSGCTDKWRRRAECSQLLLYFYLH